MFLLTTLLAIVAPESDAIDVDAIPEAPKPCTVEWSPDHDERFIEITQDRIDRRCSELIEALDYDAEPQSVHIDIGGSMHDFTVRVSITRDGEMLYDGEVSAETCKCGPRDLTVFTAQHVAAAIEELRKPDDPPPKVDHQPAHQVDQPPNHQPPPPEKHGLRWAGVGVGVVGLGLGVTGGVLMTRSKDGPALGNDGGFGSLSTRRHPLAVTASLVGVGAAFFSAGVAMIIIDAKRTKDRKRATVTPSIAPEHVGLTLSGKF